jgi:hypothetical protein
VTPSVVLRFEFGNFVAAASAALGGGDFGAAAAARDVANRAARGTKPAAFGRDHFT